METTIKQYLTNKHITPTGTIKNPAVYITRYLKQAISIAKGWKGRVTKKTSSPIQNFKNR